MARRRVKKVINYDADVYESYKEKIKFTDNPLDNSYNNTQKLFNTIKYSQNRASNDTMDCSQFASFLTRKEINDMKLLESSGKVNFQTNFENLEKIYASSTNTVRQRDLIKTLGEDYTKITNKRDIIGSLKAGMAIYMTYTGDSTGRHVVKVVNEPLTGKLMIAESRSVDAVVLTEPEKWFSRGKAGKSNTTFLAIDPFEKDRDLLNQLSKNQKKEKDLFISSYNKLKEDGFSNDGLSKVSYKGKGSSNESESDKVANEVIKIRYNMIHGVPSGNKVNNNGNVNANVKQQFSANEFQMSDFNFALNEGEEVMPTNLKNSSKNAIV